MPWKTGFKMPNLVRVRIIATTPSEIDSGGKNTHFHDMLDYAPDFENSKEILDRLIAIEDSYIRVWHLDPIVPALPNVAAPVRVQ